MPGADSRDTFQGSKEALMDTLRPFVTAPNFVKYHESKSENIDKHLLYQHAPLLRALQRLQPNMSFPRVVMEDSLVGLARELKFFEDSPTMLLEWSRVCGARVRTLGRHMAQSILKARGSTSSWVALVMSQDVLQAFLALPHPEKKKRGNRATDACCLGSVRRRISELSLSF